MDVGPSLGFSVAPNPLTTRAMSELVVARVLIVDDDEQSASALASIFEAEGFRAETAPDGETALQYLDESTDVVLTDLEMPRLNGIQLIERGKALAPNAVFMVMTGHGEFDTAVEAVKKGADQYLTKPLDVEAVVALTRAAAHRAAQHRELVELRAKAAHSHQVRPILGEHPLMQSLLKIVRQVAPSRASVLITGESGTGKELIAHALHDWSGRTGRLIAVNCAALAESVLESELFGHERGAFTGATTRREGRFKQADRGTLFLDEISEITPAVQLKLLRFLQEHEFEAVGSNRTEHVDVRVVAACNRDLRARVADGLFREDLYFRLNVVDVFVPPLRDRLSDLPMLAEHYIQKACVDNQRADVPQLSEAAFERLMKHRWPGNIRELRNAMERAVILCERDSIEFEHLPAAVGEAPLKHALELSIPGATMADIEKLAVLKTLEAVRGSVPKAAELLGISIRTIQYRLKEWNVDRAGLSEGTESVAPRVLKVPQRS
jgi:DNA-binding NtrC family response regulator